MNHNHVKPNMHATQFVGSNAHHSTDFYHQHAVGTNNNNSVGHNVIGHSHDHAPHPHVQTNHHSHAVDPTPVSPTSHPNPDQVFPGGAGGVNNGTTTGRAAPAAIGAAGKPGGSGGGGAILVITDSVSGTITYNTSARSATDSDNFTASDGFAYVLINQ
jgi:hypothetical protein